MSEQQTYAPVIRSVTVAASQQRAFTVFTEQFDRWWPREYSIGEEDFAGLMLEPLVGVHQCEQARRLARARQHLAVEPDVAVLLGELDQPIGPAIAHLMTSVEQ